MNMFSFFPGHDQLKNLVHLRSLAIAAQLLTLGIVWKALGLKLQWLPMLSSIAVLAAANAYTLFRLKSSRPVTNPEFFAQLCIDVFVLSVLLYHAGGSANPFVSLYLLPLVIAAAILPATYTWGMAALTTACYSALMFYRIPLPYQMQMSNAFSTHVLGMWMGFVISAAVVAYFVVKMAEAARSRDKLLAEVREEAMRNERIVALGTQAAGAAHELGTPLATMAVVIGELKHDLPQELHVNIELLNEQLRGCRRILDKMLHNAQEVNGTRLQAADEFIAEALDEWKLLRPAARYTCAIDQRLPAIDSDVNLRAALMNLLNNAADASEHTIEISAMKSEGFCIVRISDKGPGLSDEAMIKAGSAFFTTKPEGRGLGLFLANATIERMGGAVKLYNRGEGGTTTEITLPIHQGDKA